MNNWIEKDALGLLYEAIEIENKMPEQGEWVLVVAQISEDLPKEIFIARWIEDLIRFDPRTGYGETVWSTHTCERIINVTHWMPLGNMPMVDAKVASFVSCKACCPSEVVKE
jgi:hypothetical protein